MPAFFWLLAAFSIVVSPAFLPLVGGKTDTKSYRIVLVVFALAALLPLFGFGTPGVVWQILLAETILFVAFIFVSRWRNRASNTLHMLASIASNGGWFLVMYVLANQYQHEHAALASGAFSREALGFFAVVIAGVLGGRLVGMQWSLRIEEYLEVETNGVKSKRLSRFDPLVIPALTAAIFACIVGYGLVSPALSHDVSVVMLLSVVQNGAYALKTRLGNRNHVGWAAVAAIVAALSFIVQWSYLLHYTAEGGSMPLALAVPYTVATVVGSVFGANISMWFEKVWGIEAEKNQKPVDLIGQPLFRFVLGSVGAFCLLYLFFGNALLALVGVAPHPLSFPFPLFAGTAWERPATLVLAGLVFCLQEVSHTLASTAGNRSDAEPGRASFLRSQAAYHALICLFYGAITFSKDIFVIFSPHLIDLVPVYIFGNVLGQFFGQTINYKITKALGFVMNVPPAKKAKA